MVAALEIDGVSKRYGRRHAVRDMSFDIRGGELFGFVGSNGAGKTTTMRIVLGVLSPDAGEVRWHGRPVDFATRRRFGYMPEERGLYPRMKVSEQLCYLGELHGLSARDARRAAQRWIDRLDIGAYAAEEVQNLSLGNQQRVQLAAALVHGPQALVLDEPFSGLDPVAVDVMSQVLSEAAAEGIPVLFSSHQLQLVERFCDRVGIVSRGRLVACGTVQELSEAAERRLLVDAPDAPADWAEGLDGVRIAGRDGTRLHLRLADHVDDQKVLHAALATGPVTAFTPERPPLSELFRDVVSRDGEAAAEEEAADAGTEAAPAAEADAGPTAEADAAAETATGSAAGARADDETATAGAGAAAKDGQR